MYARGTVDREHTLSLYYTQPVFAHLTDISRRHMQVYARNATRRRYVRKG